MDPVTVVPAAAGMDPNLTAVLGGVAASHVLEPLVDKFPPQTKPLAVCVVTVGVVAAAAHFVSGMAWDVALRYGLVSTVTAFLNHIAIFRDGSLLDVLKTVAGEKKPVAGA